MVTPSAGSTAVFVLVVAFVVVALLRGVAHADRTLGGGAQRLRVAIATLTWLGITGALSHSGVLGGQSMPPPLMLFFFGSMAVAITLALSSVGRRLAQTVPIAALVAFHGFRLPLELVLHAWADEGVLPIQMTYSGHNFDIVTGIAAIAVGLWLWRTKPPKATAKRVVLAFNLLGLALLVTVATIAVLSSPVPIRQYMNDPPVLLALHVPYGWIVPFCVGGALAGHLIIFRWLRATD